MNILIINQFRNAHQMMSECVPRIGETVNLFSDPAPKVIDVVWFPPEEIIKYHNAGGCDVVVIVQ